VYAVEIKEPGGPEALQWTAAADPAPAAGEVLVEVAAAGVNRADLLQRQGFYPPPPGTPPYPGLECSGRIAALGAGVSGWEVGQQVAALVSGGGYAQLVAVPAGQLLPLPAGTDLVEAAGLPEAACTVWSNVFMLARLGAGETLLVHGGASGIGTFATQLAVARGATVAVTASGPKLDRCRELGASILVDYRSEDFVAAVREATAGRGADVILDIIGAAYLPQNVETLATGGRLVTIGLQGGRRGELDLGLLLAKRASVQATSLRARPPAEKAAIVAEVAGEVWPLVGSGAVRAVVDRVVPMDRAGEAHRRMDDAEHFGKVLLQNPDFRD
jgi:putative PIG3 family NAD(P)H quinone oxidoreductase